MPTWSPSDRQPVGSPCARLEDLLGREFVVTVELDPPKGPELTTIFSQAAALKGRVAAVNIADSPMARMRMSPIALASLIRERFGIDTVFHLTCRDRNVLGLQSELLGAWALGVRNILALTGDPPAMGDHPQATGVFDVDAVGLVRITSDLNRGLDAAGNKLNGTTRFLAGVAVNPTADDLAREIVRFEQKVAAGAAFTQTQPVYDPGDLEPFLGKTAHLGLPCLAGVLPIKSREMLAYLDRHVPGIKIPGSVRERILGVPPGMVRDESVKLSAEIIRGLRERVAGVHIMPVGDYSMVSEILSQLE